MGDSRFTLRLVKGCGRNKGIKEGSRSFSKIVPPGSPGASARAQRLRMCTGQGLGSASGGLLTSLMEGGAGLGTAGHSTSRSQELPFFG